MSQSHNERPRECRASFTSPSHLPQAVVELTHSQGFPEQQRSILFQQRGTIGIQQPTHIRKEHSLLGNQPGKPDLIAVRNGDAVIIDAKTGRPSPAQPTAPKC